MPRPLRTNPAYAHLAYQKALANRVIGFLRRTYVGDELTDPREILVCEDVFQQDQQVPQEEVVHFIEKLTEQVASLEMELRRFQLVSPTRQGHHESKREKGPKKHQQEGNPKDGQGRRHQ